MQNKKKAWPKENIYYSILTKTLDFTPTFSATVDERTYESY